MPHALQARGNDAPHSGHSGRTFDFPIAAVGGRLTNGIGGVGSV